MQKPLVGVQAGSPERRDLLAALVEETQPESVKTLTELYCAMEDDHPTQRFLQDRPDIVLVDLEQPRAAIRSLFVLRSVLPETWLWACGPTADPMLVIEAMQAGAREFLPTPVQAPALAAAFSRYLVEKQRTRTGSKPKGKVYSVTAAKGSAGATSVAVNMATTLARAPGRHVALFDLTGPLGDIAGYLKLKPQFSLADALSSADKLDSELLETLTEKAGNVSILASGTQLDASPASITALTKLIKVAITTHTDVFIDLPGTLDPNLLQTVIDASSAILVVTTPELLALRRTYHLLGSLESRRCEDRLRLILNRDEHRNCLDVREIAKALGRPIYWKLPNDYRAAVRAIREGKPMVELNHSDLADSYRQLTEKLTGVVIPKPGRRFLKFAWSKSP